MADVEVTTDELLKKHGTYIRINEDLTNKCQEFKVLLGKAQNEILHLRNESMQDKLKNSVLRKAFFEIQHHGKEFIVSFEKIIGEANERLGFTEEEQEIHLNPIDFRPPSRAQNIDPNNTEFKNYALNTVCEEEENVEEQSESAFCKTRGLISSTPFVSSTTIATVQNVKVLRDIKNTRQPSAGVLANKSKMPGLNPIETPSRANVPSIFRKLSSEIIEKSYENESTVTDLLKLPSRAQSEDKENTDKSFTSVESVDSSIHHTVVDENHKLQTIQESIISENVTIRSRHNETYSVEHEEVVGPTPSDLGVIKIPENIPSSTQNPVRLFQESSDDDENSEKSPVKNNKNKKVNQKNSKEALKKSNSNDDNESDWEDVANDCVEEIKKCIVEMEEIPITIQQVESFMERYHEPVEDEESRSPQPSTSKQAAAKKTRRATKRKQPEEPVKIKLQMSKRKRQNTTDSISTVESEFNTSSVSTSTALNKTKLKKPKAKKRKSATFKIRTSGGGSATKSKKNRNSGSIGSRASNALSESIATRRPSRRCKPTELKEPSLGTKLRRD